MKRKVILVASVAVVLAVAFVVNSTVLANEPASAAPAPGQAQAATGQPQTAPTPSTMMEMCPRMKALAVSTDPNATDPNATDPNATDPNATDPNATDPNATDPNK